MARVARFAWFTLSYNVLVILWGAYVRATGSGAGCGSHWPLCNGEVIPRAASVETLIEFSHRATSGLALLAVVALYAWVRRVCAPGHAARRAAAWGVFFMLTEAAVGAGLVLFQLVADNASMARALFMAVHLANTFVLLACLTLTAHWLSDGKPVRLADQPGLAALLGLGACGILLVGASGAVSALGDTLFPATSLPAALAADLSATSHLLIRLRILHPAFAIAVAIGLTVVSRRLTLAEDDRRGQLAAHLVPAVAVVQIALGFLNVILLAPVWLQMVHLLLADVLWIAFILLSASALAHRRLVEGVSRRPATATAS